MTSHVETVHPDWKLNITELDGSTLLDEYVEHCKEIRALDTDMGELLNVEHDIDVSNKSTVEESYHEVEICQEESPAKVNAEESKSSIHVRVNWYEDYENSFKVSIENFK